MDLAVRPLEEKDFPACMASLRGHLAYPDAVIAQIPVAWKRWLRSEAMTAAVFEDWSPSRPVMLAFAVSVFVTDEWVSMARSSTEPFLSARTVQSELDGTDSPVLRPDAIQRNPAAPLNILNLHYCEKSGLPQDTGPALRYRVLQAFLDVYRGYRIKEVIQELWDEIDPAFLLKGWGRIRNDYSSYFADRGERIPPIGRRPFLIGITREEASLDPGDIISPVFTFAPPRFAFSRAERRLLRQALLGRTDAELTRCLGVAMSTVKSHWRSAYSRVARIDPRLLPGSGAENGGSAIRGQEKRRRLLEYLRRHPEELGPAVNTR
jgi:DNA-binding CsgD family transcriptional regulator